MTKRELKKKMEEYINNCQHSRRDEWYLTDRAFASHVLTDFADEILNIKLEPIEGVDD